MWVTRDFLNTIRRVIIVQRRLTHYRVPLFELLRTQLAADGITLELLVGKARASEEAKRDAGTLAWATQTATTYFMGGRVCWQGIHKYLSGADLVIVTQENGLLVNLLLLLLPRKFKLAFWGHGANLQSANPNGLKERFKRWTTQHVDWWFVYTGMSTDLVTRSGFPLSRITNLENTVDTADMQNNMAAIGQDELIALRGQLGLGAGRVGIFLGSLYAEKRLDFVMQAASQLHLFDPQFRLLIIGDGPLRDTVQNSCAKLPWCVWVGAKTGRDKALHLALADVLLNPGGVGLVILDAFAAQLPMVTTNCKGHGPEIAYLRQDENGLMTENTLEDFVSGVQRVLGDDVYRTKLVAGCRAAAGHYTIENMAKNFTRGIRQVLNM